MKNFFETFDKTNQGESERFANGNEQPGAQGNMLIKSRIVSRSGRHHHLHEIFFFLPGLFL
jgi:hypothetical protein